MSDRVDIQFPGQEKEIQERDGFLDSFDNATRQSIIIDLEMTTIPVLLGICFLIGIIGNGALFYTICKAKKFRNVPNSFLLNISIVNIFMLIVCPPMIATSFVLERRWPFGNVACKMVHSIPQACVAVSMFSIIALSIERYGAFAAPPRHRTAAKNRACIGNMVIWLLGAACGFPLAIFAGEESDHNDSTKQRTIVCRVFNKQIWMPLYPKIHTIVSISFLFIIPIILCSIFYLSLSCVVCAKKQKESRAEEDSMPLKNGTRSSRSGTLTKTNTSRTIDSRTSMPTLKRAVRKRRTMAKVALFLMLQFTLLWAPQWAYTLRWYFSFERVDQLWYLMNLVGLVCIYLNAALTPFTVVVFNRIFRQQLGKYLCCCFSCLSCCICPERKENRRASISSSSDINSGKKSSCCCPCVGGEADDDREGSDSQSEHSKDVKESPLFFPQDHSNVYQELPGNATYYDSCTIPMDPQHRHNYPHERSPHRPLSEQHSLTYSPSEPPNRSSYAVGNNLDPYYPASYHGDEVSPFHHGPPSAYSQGPYRTVPREVRYTSEPYLSAQAPKYSKIFQPQYPPHVEQATSIKEIPAL